MLCGHPMIRNKKDGENCHGKKGCHGSFFSSFGWEKKVGKHASPAETGIREEREGIKVKRVRLTVAYDGTNYRGWQVQPNGITIEQVLNEKLSALLGEEIVVTGASRTDSGVHSLGNIAIFDTNTRMPAEKISFALNQRLPEDIVVQDSREVLSDWHPRYQNSRKTYEYRILNRTFRMPGRRFDTYFYYHPLDVEKMQQAAAYLEGEHDFKSFCAVGAQVKTTTRTIYSCNVTRDASDVITVRVTGNGFLYNMVRIIAGTLIKVGGGELAPEEIPLILEKKDRSAAGPTAPAHGLTMIGIEYEGENVEMDEAVCG